LIALSRTSAARPAFIAWWSGAEPEDPTAPPEVDPSPPPVEVPAPPPITVPGPPSTPPIQAATGPHGSHDSKVTEAEEQSDPSMLPVEPNEGLVVPGIPSDPDHDRQKDPTA
jgi:hypothetical protein